ncbi:U5 snRNP-specific protein-like factor [Dissoconium aciculare CBS 342.82]|uniref:U5 snRNP-specific protein-like factor n=1 Tax=Dissoconium aciculare CBS 342.82 TaxID=1314786 RepID=A0A6J3MDI0_9PEZI|nr:U5 snRNP-specific protein-like factor [Dissoconium aciculare CBS 342.82]KAF1825659.1 U5 snRNP-specific protein-like factor [Dissoconium aciculare CBS 342.82]
MSGEKRPAPELFGSTQLVKRQKSSSNLKSDALVKASGNGALIQQGGRGAAGLQAPVMELSGHSGEIFCARFDPTGAHIASGSMDRSILLWNTSGECANYRLLTGHKSAVLDLQWSRDSQVLYSAGADAHVSSWNVETGERIRRHVGHEEVINCLDVSRRGEEFLASGGDDGSISLWDPRQKAAIDYIETDYPITALCLGDAGGNELFSGAVDNIIQVWDLRMKKTVYSLTGHADTITSLTISPDGQTLLSNSHDSTVRTWDVRPFAPEDRSVRTLDGAQAGLEKNLIRACWDPSEGKRVAVGGGDGTATVWDVQSGRLLHKLPGHKGTVNDVRISPDGSMILSASTDKTMLLGELPR